LSGGARHFRATRSSRRCGSGSPDRRSAQGCGIESLFLTRRTSLKRHKAAQGEHLLALGIVPELVVDNGIGEPWMPASFSTGWRRFANANGFEGITFHTLRHGAATLLLASGVADAVAIKLMGHADTKIPRRYLDVVSELQRDAAARMDALLGGSGSVVWQCAIESAKLSAALSMSPRMNACPPSQ
jgi:integrase